MYDPVELFTPPNPHEQLPQLFSLATANRNTNVTARSSAGFFASQNGGCISVIAPSRAALTSNANTQITTGWGIWGNSNAYNAIDLSGGSQVVVVVTN